MYAWWHFSKIRWTIKHDENSLQRERALFPYSFRALKSKTLNNWIWWFEMGTKLDVILATGGRMPEIDSSWSIIFFFFRQLPSHICIIAIKRSPCYDRIKSSKFQFRHEKINKIQLLGDETKKFRSDLTLLICCTFLLHVESVQDIFVS